jgi:hypothetical protein
MQKIQPAEQTRNPLAKAIAQVAIEALEIIASNPEAVAQLRAIVGAAQAPAQVVDADGLLPKQKIAKALDVSVATIDRLTREGMPIAAHVGDARRFDLDACRAWLAARGKKPTTAPKKAHDVDIDDVLHGAGLTVST